MTTKSQIHINPHYQQVNKKSDGQNYAKNLQLIYLMHYLQTHSCMLHKSSITSRFSKLLWKHANYALLLLIFQIVGIYSTVT